MNRGLYARECLSENPKGNAIEFVQAWKNLKATDDPKIKVCLFSYLVYSNHLPTQKLALQAQIEAKTLKLESSQAA